MRFASIGSGSKGNATLVQWQDTLIMVDCGFSAKEVDARLARIGLSGKQLSGIVVTHEHGDHISGVGVLARKYQLPVWMTVGTAKKFRGGKLPELNYYHGHESFSIGEITIQPFTVPHDAREPCQLVFENGQHKLGILTDVGSITPHIIEMLDACDALMLECNHDVEMLARGPYPLSLKERVGGRLGHLSNKQAAELLLQMDHSRLQHLVAMHLSEQNNSETLARGALCEVLNCEQDWIAIANQEHGFSWRELS